MKYYSLKLKFILKEDVLFRDVSFKIGNSLQHSMYRQEQLKELHDKKQYKYVFSPLVPFVKKEIYKKGESYSIFITSFDESTIVKFNYALTTFEDKLIKIINTDLREKNLNNKIITELETVTPIIITVDGKPWHKNVHSIDLLIQKIYDNLEKKYDYFFNDDIQLKTDFNKYNFFEKITVLSKKPISRRYKNIKLIGYKVKINVGSNEVAQKLAKTAIVMGIGEKNSIIGSGYVRYKTI